MLRAKGGPTGQASILYMLYVGHCELDLYSWYIRVAAIVLLLWLLSRSAQAVLERCVPSVASSDRELHSRIAKLVILHACTCLRAILSVFIRILPGQ